MEEIDIIEYIRQNHNLPESAEIHHQIYQILIPLIATIIILLNLAVVTSSGVIIHTGQQPRSTYIFLGNVALADLLMGVTILGNHYYPIEYRNEYSCAIPMCMIAAATLVSVFSIGLIAVDRYLYIVNGLRYHQLIYPKRARMMISLAWLLGITIGFLPAMGWRGDTDNGRICWFSVLAPTALVILTTIIGFVPIIINIILYSIILYYALRKVIELKHAHTYNGAISSINNEHNSNEGLRVFTGHSTKIVITSDNPDSDLSLKKSIFTGKLRNIFKKNIGASVKQGKNNQTPSKWKAIKVVLLTTGCFIITWTPYFIASTWFNFFCNVNETPSLCNNLRIAIASPLALLGISNSILNPFIYAWWHNGFRKSVRKMYYRYRQKFDFSTSKCSSNGQHSTILSDLTSNRIESRNVIPVDNRNEPKFSNLTTIPNCNNIS